VNREKQIIRLIAKMATLAAYSYRHRRGHPYVYPDNELSYTENFMNMLWRMTEPKYVASPVIARALDVLFILHADHEQNCSSTTMRVIGSAQTDPYLSMAGAAAALAGPLHGGANEEVLRMLDEIGSVKNIPPTSSASKKVRSS
jgi:citrate synthase